MTYSIVGVVAILVVVLLNLDFIFVKHFTGNARSKNAYRVFLLSTITYFITDAIWGLLDEYHLVTALFIDTEIYFLMMACSVLFWTINVYYYLKKDNIWKKILVLAGFGIFIYAVTVIVMNIFTPILFEFNDQGVYHPLTGRYIFLTLQFTMYILTSLYVFVAAFKRTVNERKRYFAVTFFGLVMSAAIIFQIIFPLLPIYAVGCMVGISIIHVFVINGEKEEHKQSLEEMVIREKAQYQLLLEAKEAANTDPLTGARSKHAYVEMEEELDRLIASGEINEFAIVVFDINGLKVINDTNGHEAGDDYIKECYQTITKYYRNTPIYRFGGDEFVAVLEGEDYQRREELQKDFDSQIELNIKTDSVIVSSGMADFNPKEDFTYRAVFIRADSIMYKKKKNLKSK